MSLQRVFVAISVCCLGFLLVSHAQETQTEVKKVPAPATSAASGKQMFTAYCASCHGEKGKGDGPAAGALKTAPADLTTLTKNNGGKFPADRVSSILRGQASVTAHGNREMPVWGPVFWQMSHGHETEVQQRIVNLTHYIESLQQK
jgi:mono/diheme cytochrome c family protein